MDAVVDQLLTAEAVFLMIAVTIGTFFIRRIVETGFPKVVQAADDTAAAPSYTNTWSVWWNKVVLYAIPVVLGTLLALTVKEFSSDEGLFTSRKGLALYGGVVGWCSSFAYKLFRQVVKKKTGLDLPGASVPPPPADPKEEEEAEGSDEEPAQDVDVPVDDASDDAQEPVVAEEPTKS